MSKSLKYNDVEAIRLFKKGNDTAYLYIYEKFQASLFLRAFRLLNNQAEAEDVTAESFIKLWNARSSFESISAIDSWLKKTTQNAALDILRHRKIVAEHVNQLVAITIEADDDWTNSDLYAEALREIYTQIELLPAKRREIFKLRYIQGLTNEEIATQLGIHNQSVRDQLSRALKFLRLVMLKKENLFSFLLIFLNTK